MNEENETKEKQEYLRINILEKGYNADEFMEYLQTLRGEKGLQIESWSKNDLIKAVQEFIRINPIKINVDLNYKEENNINNENDNNKLNINNDNNNIEKIDNIDNIDNDNNNIKNNDNNNNNNIQNNEKNKVNNNNVNNKVINKVNNNNVNNKVINNVNNNINNNVKNNVNNNVNNNNPYNIKPLIKESVKCKLSEITDISTKINIEITISNPLVTEGGLFSKSFVTYLVKTTPFNFEVRRRFSDFEWLHNILMAQYINCIIPPIYKKTSLKIISVGNNDDLIINKRINILQKFMKEIITHPLLRNSQILFDFISIKDEKTFNNKKNIYNKLSTPTKVEQIKTLNGVMDIGVDKPKEDMAEKIKTISEGNVDLMKRLTKEYKILNTQIEDISTKMKEIANIWDELYKKGESNSESEIILGLYDIMYKVMDDWANMEKNHVNLINLKIREYFRYIRYEYKTIKDYYNTYDNAKNQYLKSYIKLMDNKERMFREEDIENWGLSNEDMKNKMNLLKNKEYSIERMLPEETKKVNDYRKMYGCYLNSLVDEYKEIQNYNGIRHKDSISNFIKGTTENYSKFHVNITNLNAYIDALKEENFK